MSNTSKEFIMRKEFYSLHERMKRVFKNQTEIEIYLNRIRSDLNKIEHDLERMDVCFTEIFELTDWEKGADGNVFGLIERKINTMTSTMNSLKYDLEKVIPCKDTPLWEKFIDWTKFGLAKKFIGNVLSKKIPVRELTK